jgi:2-haloacid dehalogenase
VPAFLDRVRRGERGWANLDVLHGESFERLAPKFGISAQDNEDLNTLARFWHELPAWPDVVGGLRRLKPRYMIAPLSNGHVALLVSMSKSLRSRRRSHGGS